MWLRCEVRGVAEEIDGQRDRGAERQIDRQRNGKGKEGKEA